MPWFSGLGKVHVGLQAFPYQMKRMLNFILKSLEMSEWMTMFVCVSLCVCESTFNHPNLKISFFFLNVCEQNFTIKLHSPGGEIASHFLN